MMVLWETSGSPVGCEHKREGYEFGFAAFTIGSVGAAVSMADGTVPSMLPIFFTIFIALGAGIVVNMKRTKKTWLLRTVEISELSKLEKLLNYADKHDVGLPALPVTEPSELTNGQLQLWAKEANALLSKTRHERVLNEMNFPERFLQQPSASLEKESEMHHGS